CPLLALDPPQPRLPGCRRPWPPPDNPHSSAICPPQRVDAEHARQLWLSRQSSLSYASLPSPEFSMRLSPLRLALKPQCLEEWFWRLVFVGVCCDFLYLGWFIV